MTRRFTCRGFEGYCFKWTEEYGEPPIGCKVGDWCAGVWITDVQFNAYAKNASAAKSRVRRKLDAVERAFRERGRR